MFQTSESCIKLHAVVVLELLLSEPCPLLQVCVKYREHISLLVILCIIMYVTKKNHNIFFLSLSLSIYIYIYKLLVIYFCF